MRKSKITKQILEIYGDDAQKMRGDFPPISIKEGKEVRSLKIKNIYRINALSKYIFNISVPNYNKSPKYLDYLSIILANQSSDLIVEIARDLAIQNDVELIQYPIFQGNYRVSLLALHKVTNPDKIDPLLNNLRQIRKDLKQRLKEIKQLILK